MKFFPRISILAVLALLMVQCSQTRIVTMNAMQPAQITFPSNIKTLLVVNRTKADKKALGVIESILTGELPGEDKAALQETMSAFQQTLMASPRFQVKTASEILPGNSLTAAFPDPLPWEAVQEFCNRYGADAIVAFELFDSNFIPTSGKRKVKKEVTDASGAKGQVEVDEFYAQGVASVTIGIRLYDPKSRTVIDQQRFVKANTWEATGTSVADAMLHLIAKGLATQQVGAMAGSSYAWKIAPMPVRISRQFYSKSKQSKELNTGARQADVNDWDGAVKTWIKGLNGADVKNAGKLCYDIAIGYEVLGNLDAAKKWAGDAWVQYGNKKARTYSAILDQRMREIEQVNEQMK